MRRAITTIPQFKDSIALPGNSLAAVPRIPLADFFGLFAPTHVLGTTYTLSLAFFEALVLPKIEDRTSLRRCVLLADRTGFERALVEAGALRGVGRDYIAACVPCLHSFHPKVWLLIGEDQAAVIVGSGNLTQSGFMGNAELFDAVHLRKGGPHRAVAEGVGEFLNGLAKQWPAGRGESDLLVLESLAEMRNAMSRLAIEMPPDDDPPVRFLSNYSGPIVEQLAEVMNGETLFVAAPYFGGSTAGLSRLRAHLKPKKVKLFPAVHNDDTIDISLSALSALRPQGVSIHRLALDEEGRFPHLKVYGSEGSGGCWLFTTSANCTEAALGGDNVEAGLLRRVSQTVLRSYFPAAPDAILPEAQRKDEYASTARWLPLCAAARGSGIDLTLAAELSDLPLVDVSFTLRFSGTSRSVQTENLFNGTSIERLIGGPFSEAAEHARSPVLLAIKGVSRGGTAVQGAAFVDRPFDLSAEPGHRSAWRAAQALLGGEGIPESADLACVFHLVNGMLDRPALQDDTFNSGGRKMASPESDESADKMAFWPPVTDELPTPSAGHGHVQSVYWFSRILSELLRPPATNESVAPAARGSLDASEDAEEPEVSTVSSRAAASLWWHAGSSFESLVERLQGGVPSAEAAKKVWALSAAVLLVTLATRRQLARLADEDLKLPTAGELVARFLRAAFGDRQNEVHEHVGDPPASDLAVRFEVVPSPDITDLLKLLFAYHHASAPRLNLQFCRDGWLSFRALRTGTDRGLPAYAESQFHRFLEDDRDKVEWGTVLRSSNALAAMDWPDHPGFQALWAYAKQASSGPDAPIGLPPELSDGWDQTCRWMRQKRRWCEIVDRLRPYCTASGCARRYQHSPANRVLAEYRPKICRGCGAVLIPNKLASEYEKRNGPLP